ncbi:MAG: tetraacyldisaccharide 4'-kinase [Alphaproteobacteria bacterium]
MRAPEFWDEPGGLASGLLAPLGAVWSGVGALRRAVSRPYLAPVPGICVGNLVAGGSGKTPLVLSLVDSIARSGVGVHVLTRGYGGRLTGPVRVDPGRHDAVAVGDEALLLARSGPCWVARDRAAGCRAAAAAGSRIIVLDDGFQNPGIAKDLSFLVIDAEYGFGNGRVIPAGPLREPVGAGLARADTVVLIGDGEPPKGVREAGRPILHAAFEPVDATGWRGIRVAAFAGIGRPAKFFASLRDAGAEIIAARPFPDHHRFSAAEIAELRRAAERADARLVTTAKDWVRLPTSVRGGIAAFEVQLRWRDPAALSELLAPVLQSAVNSPDLAGKDW